MKTTSRLLSSIIAALTVLFFVSCNHEDPIPPQPGIIQYNAPDNILCEAQATFTDLTMDAASRTWTFEGGSPATSNSPSQVVTFKESGTKKVTLTVVFNNTATDTKEFTITVLDPISGKIGVSSLTPMGCIKLDKEVTFSVQDATGNADTFEWTFEGGSPETSTSATPTVIFKNRDRDMKVTCKMSRKADGATFEMKETYITGNYPLRNMIEGYDGISFETEKVPGWIAWTDKGYNPYSVVEGGALGTSHSLKIDCEALMEQLPEGSPWTDCFPRDSWAQNVPELEPGKNYELSMWLKADHYDNEFSKRGIGCIQIVSWLESWMKDGFIGKTAEAGWNEVFGTDFAASPNKVHYEAWFTGKNANEMLPDDDWHQFVVPFTVSSTVRNIYPYFRVYCKWYKALYVDEIEINLVED